MRRFARTLISSVAVLSLLAVSLQPLFQLPSAMAVTVIKPPGSLLVESISFKKSNGQLADVVDNGQELVINFADSDRDGLDHLALEPQITYVAGAEVMKAVITLNPDKMVDELTPSEIEHGFDLLSGNWVLLPQEQPLKYYLRVYGIHPLSEFGHEETHPLKLNGPPADESNEDPEDSEKPDEPEFPENPEVPEEFPPVTPEEPFTGEPPRETDKAYDRPSEAQPATVNPLFGVIARIPPFYRFAFPRLQVITQVIKGRTVVGRLKIGTQVNTEFLPKYFLGDLDDTDSGILEPALNAADADVFCPTGKHIIVSNAPNDFKFLVTFEVPLQGLFLFMLDEDGDGNYTANNAFGNNELLDWRIVGGAEGGFSIPFTSRRLADMSFAGDTGLYGRAVLVAVDGETRLPPLKPSGDNSEELMNTLQQYLPKAKVAEGDDNVGDPGKTWSPFGDLMEGEAETYCFLPRTSKLFEYPSEPRSGVPKPGQPNTYEPEALSYDHDQQFYLGHPEDRIDPVLVQQGKLDPEDLSFELEPKRGDRVEPMRSQKPGDDRNGVVRRGFVKETAKRGELLFEVGRSNVIEVTATLEKGGGATADGKRILYLNALLDKQQDGGYQGRPFVVARDAQNDWIIQNYEIVFPDGGGTVTVEVPFHLEDVAIPQIGTYLRLMLNESPAQVDNNEVWNGSEEAFDTDPMFGEAETYFVNFVPRRKTFDSVVLHRSRFNLASILTAQVDVGTKDYDGDGIVDDQDPDTDGDGIPDVDEGSENGRDTDGFGLPDYLDPDSDADGQPDAVEGNPAAFQRASYASVENLSDLDGSALNAPIPATFQDNTGSSTGGSNVDTTGGTTAPSSTAKDIATLRDEVKEAIKTRPARRFDANVRPPAFAADVDRLKLIQKVDGPTTGCLREGVAYTLNDIAGHPYESHIRKAAFLGLVEGVNNQFDSKAPLLRDQLAKIVAVTLCLAIESDSPPSYTDVKKGAWYYEWVEAVTRAGIFKGHDFKYRPGDIVNRAEFYTVLARIAEITDTDLGDLRAKVISQVKDVNGDDWFADGVGYGFLSQGLQEDTTVFNGAEPMPRAEAIRLLVGHLMPFIGILE